MMLDLPIFLVIVASITVIAFLINKIKMMFEWIEFLFIIVSILVVATLINFDVGLLFSLVGIAVIATIINILLLKKYIKNIVNKEVGVLASSISDIKKLLEVREKSLENIQTAQQPSSESKQSIDITKGMSEYSGGSKGHAKPLSAPTQNLDPNKVYKFKQCEDGDYKLVEVP